MLGHDEPVRSDNPWQQVARRLQSEWRESRGLAPGLHNGEPLGSRLLPEDGAPPRLAGYLTEPAKRQVQAAVAEATQTGALLSRPRLWVDLLSSQPLCFNLFGDMAEDPQLASAVFSCLMPDVVTSVNRIRFEYSPGRSDPRYTGARSAFDVFVEGVGPRGRGFIGIEVKYHESMNVAAATDRGYAELARTTRAFHEQAIPSLLQPPRQQLLLDHLLALRLLQADAAEWNWGLFVLLHPLGNKACGAVASSYSAALADSGTFRVISLERICQLLLSASAGTWAVELRRRYLGDA